MAQTGYDHGYGYDHSRSNSVANSPQHSGMPFEYVRVMRTKSYCVSLSDVLFFTCLLQLDPSPAKAQGSQGTRPFRTVTVCRAEWAGQARRRVSTDSTVSMTELIAPPHVSRKSSRILMSLLLVTHTKMCSVGPNAHFTND
jgi:hypothetical protein